MENPKGLTIYKNLDINGLTRYFLISFVYISKTKGGRNNEAGRDNEQGRNDERTAE